MRNQTNYNRLVGRKDNSYYFCDYIFEDKDFCGATATILDPVTKDDYDYRTSLEGAMDCFEVCLWKESDTLLSYEDWVQSILDTDGDEAIFDHSGYNLWDQLREIGFEESEYPVFECCGGGRSFSSDMKFDKIYDIDLWNKIKAIELKAEKSI